MRFSASVASNERTLKITYVEVPCSRSRHPRADESHPAEPRSEERRAQSWRDVLADHAAAPAPHRRLPGERMRRAPQPGVRARDTAGPASRALCPRKPWSPPSPGSNSSWGTRGRHAHDVRRGGRLRPRHHHRLPPRRRTRSTPEIDRRGRMFRSTRGLPCRPDDDGAQFRPDRAGRPDLGRRDRQPPSIPLLARRVADPLTTIALLACVAAVIGVSFREVGTAPTAAAREPVGVPTPPARPRRLRGGPSPARPPRPRPAPALRPPRVRIVRGAHRARRHRLRRGGCHRHPPHRGRGRRPPRARSRSGPHPSVGRLGRSPRHPPVASRRRSPAVSASLRKTMPTARTPVW